MSNNLKDKSYEQHANWFHTKFSTKAELEADLDMVQERGNANFMRHLNMYYPLQAFFQKKNDWLVVGDNYGLDTSYVRSQGQQTWGSDISTTMLEIAKEKGYIGDFSEENAEKLSFKDASFDYVLCKEAYHHFPRPYIGVYEMLRVARKAVVLIEPQDVVLKMPILMWLKNICDIFGSNTIDKLWKNRYSFEVVGNFVYKISDREVEKIAMGIGLPSVAFFGINDFYANHPKFYEVPLDANFVRKVGLKTKFKNLLCRLGLIPYQLLCCVIFVEKPDVETVAAMQKIGFRHVILPKNPYI